MNNKKQKKFKKDIETFLKKYDRKICSSFVYRSQITLAMKRNVIISPYENELFDMVVFFRDKPIEIKFLYDDNLECKIMSEKYDETLDCTKLSLLEEWENLCAYFIRILYYIAFGEIIEEKEILDEFVDIIYSI